MGEMRRFRPLWIAALFVLCALALAGCDAAYDLVMENHTEREVQVTLYGRLTYKLRPCSVQIATTTGPADPAKNPIRAEVKDAAGALVFSAEVQPARIEGHSLPVILVRVPEKGESACPRPVTGSFVLVVKSYSREETSVWLGDARLGTVKGLEEITFGPLKGGWADAKRIEVRGPDDKPISYSLRADYNLGETPRFSIGFTYVRPEPTK
jgi:hypothetical protein